MPDGTAAACAALEHCRAGTPTHCTPGVAPAGSAPPPLPLYAEQPQHHQLQQLEQGASVSSSSGSAAALEPLGGSLDVAFELLRLFAVVGSGLGSSEEGGEDGWGPVEAALPQLLAQLLR